MQLKQRQVSDDVGGDEQHDDAGRGDEVLDDDTSARAGACALRDSIRGGTGVFGGAPVCLLDADKCVGVQG